MPQPKPKSFGGHKYLPLPADFHPVHATVDEVCAYARQSRWTTFKKIKLGRYRTYKDGRITKIIFTSVIADIERLMTGGSASAAPLEPVEKRRVGRPKNPKPEAATASPAE